MDLLLKLHEEEKEKKGHNLIDDDLSLSVWGSNRSSEKNAIIFELEEGRKRDEIMREQL